MGIIFAILMQTVTPLSVYQGTWATDSGTIAPIRMDQTGTVYTMLDEESCASLTSSYGFLKTLRAVQLVLPKQDNWARLEDTIFYEPDRLRAKANRIERELKAEDLVYKTLKCMEGK